MHAQTSGWKRGESRVIWRCYIHLFRAGRERLRRKEIDGRRSRKQRYTHLQHPLPHTIYLQDISVEKAVLSDQGRTKDKEENAAFIPYLFDVEMRAKRSKKACFYVWVRRQEAATKQNKEELPPQKKRRKTLGEYIQFLVAPPFGSGVSIYSQGRREREKRRGEKRRILPLLPPPLRKGLPSLIYQDLLFPSKKIPSTPRTPSFLRKKNFPPEKHHLHHHLRRRHFLHPRPFLLPGKTPCVTPLSLELRST